MSQLHSYDVDEWTIAEAMLGESLQMVKCETIDVEVPAFCRDRPRM
jgi:UbiD family decarboxylase